MFSQYFGDYLLKNNQITSEQLGTIMGYVKSHRVKLGLIAVSEGLLSTKQADELNKLQLQMDKRFGDIAIEKGYLTKNDISHLLKMQGNPYLMFIQALDETGIMHPDDVDVKLASYQKEKHLSNSDIIALKSGDIDTIIPVFIQIENPLYLQLLSIALRNIVRFVTPEIRFDEVYKVTEFSAKYIAMQKTEGLHNGLFAIGSDSETLLYIADGYAKDTFDSMNEDSFDSICEFINCINGLFATYLSQKNINIDMLPPEYFTNGKIKSKDEFYVVPVYIHGKKVELIVAIDCELEIM